MYPVHRGTYLLCGLITERRKFGNVAGTHDPSTLEVSLDVPVDVCEPLTKVTAPLVLGELGLRNAATTQLAAHWAHWADTLPTILTRHR